MSWFGDMNTDIFSTISDRSGLPLEALKVLAKEDMFLTAEEVRDLGIIDQVLYPTKVELGYPLPKDGLPDWLCKRVQNLNPGCVGKSVLPVPVPRPST